MDKQRHIPRHVAIIMDGNGRWAKLRNKDRSYGHMHGVEPIRAAVRAAVRNGVEYLTLYAFSVENWNRPTKEVDTLMELFCQSVVSESEELQRQGVRVSMIGNRYAFSRQVQESLHRIETETASGQRLHLILALNYSSRAELVYATQCIAQKVADGALKVAQIDEHTISSALYTATYPDPDLIIRTSGEMRLSNFLLWQASYAEFYFPEVLWPDFTEASFDEALEQYALRDRRFGRVSSDEPKDEGLDA